jgi:DmsE family decaheme c-type cytochrome
VGSTWAADDDAKDLVLKGDSRCTACHEPGEFPHLFPIGKTRHGTMADGRTPSCTNCHGETQKHSEGQGQPDLVFDKRHEKSSSATRNDACMSCHQRDAKRSHWEGSTHQARDLSCDSCHNIHSGTDPVRDKRTQTEVCYKCHKEQRAQANRPSHHPVPEGKMACSDCHNVHGSFGPKLMTRDSTNATCYTCHAEKRGPFVRQHDPVAEDCSNCHNPHGSTVAGMLKTRAPMLCQQCHTPHAAGSVGVIGSPMTALTPGKNATTMWQGNSCMSCHTQVHGSNNPNKAKAVMPLLMR